MVEIAVKETEFCRDWRNRHIAHRDLDLAITDTAQPLKAASRKQVKDALFSIVNVLNALEAHYMSSTTYFKLGVGAGGAVSLIYILDDGIRADVERMERLRRGEVHEADFARDL
ncbi:MAG: AbiU2 domain-containing protein [Methyloceanibacter sp.]